MNDPLALKDVSARHRIIGKKKKKLQPHKREEVFKLFEGIKQ